MPENQQPVGALRPHQLPGTDLIRDDDVLILDSEVAGTRKIRASDLSAISMAESGDSVFYRRATVDSLLAARDERIEDNATLAAEALTDSGSAMVQAAEAEDSAGAAMALAQAAVAAAAGFPVEDYLGEITALAQPPGAAGSFPGGWWQISTDGTLTDAAVSGMVVKSGDRLLSNGVAWIKYVLPPTYLPNGSVQRAALEKRLRDILTPLDSDDFGFLIVDANARIGFAVKLDGTVHGKFALQDNAVTEASIGTESVSRGKLSAAVQAVLSEPLISSDYAWAVIDPEGRIGLAIKNDGTVEGKFALPAGSVNSSKIAAGGVARSNLSTDLSESVPVRTAAAMEFKWCVVDDQDRVALGIRADGTVFARLQGESGTLSGSTIAVGSLPLSRLDAPTKRALYSGPGDIITDEPDNLRRGARVDFSAITSATAGAVPVQFPPLRTPVLYGINSSGVSLELSRASEFVARGINDRGDWAAPSGAPAASATAGDFWTVTTGGTFEGVTYVTGNRIYCNGSTRMSVTVTPVFAKAKPGEFFAKGEFNPGSFAPVSPADGELWIASASGTFSGMTFAAGDTLLRIGSAWLAVPREDPKTVANGAAWSFRVRCASEIQVRRADKSGTAVTVPCYGYTTSNQRKVSDGIIFRGDSLVHTNGLASALRALIDPRQLTSFSWSSANSEQVIASALKDIQAGDPYRGWLHLWMFGTNDVGFIEPTKRGVLRAARLSGAADGRCVFMTIPGQFSMTFNGDRIVHGAQEDLTAGANVYWDLEQWFAATFPGRHIRTLDAMIQRAPSIPSLHHPGMTEAAACAAYGAAPSSFFFDYASKPFTAGDLNFAGYRSAAGLPSGGTDGDYYLRTANGPIGQPIIRWGGAWVEYGLDVTHPTAAGNAAIADAIADFLNANSL